MESGFQRKQRRKRNLVAWGGSIGAVAVFVLGWWLIETFGLLDVTDYSGPILVKLGSPDGEELPEVEQQPEAQSDPAEVPPQPEQEPDQPPPVTEPVENPDAFAAPPSPSLRPSIAPSPRPSAKPSPQVSPRPSARPSPAPSLTPIASPKASDTPKPVLVKGQEYGNSHELSSTESSGRMGRSLYVPIPYYMPLPQTIEGAVYDRIKPNAVQSLERRQQIFTDFYSKDGSQWRQSRRPEMEDRPALWQVLQDAGYDLNRADYKRSVRSDVVLTFTLGAPVNGRPSLKNLTVQQSSGNGDVDAAVAYGFQKSTYFNDTGHDVSGRFTYRFD